VITYESGNAAGERMCDIFTEEGVFFARVALTIDLNSQEPFSIAADIRGGRFYILQEKENGHKLLTAYQMEWKNPLP